MKELGSENAALRQLIDQEGLDPKTHARAIAQVGLTHPHTIKPLSHPERETCVTYWLR